MGEQKTVVQDQELTRQKKSGLFGVDVLTLVGGTIIAQLIGIFSAPLITRLYGADAFGLSALFSSLVSTVAVMACLRYELTIMLPEKDDDAVNLLALSLIITSATSLILVPVIWLFGENVALLLNAPGIQPYLWLIPLMVFLSGSFSAINYWNSRKRQFGRLSKTQVYRAVTSSGIQLGLGFTGHVSGGSLISAGVVGQVVATSTLGYQAWRSDVSILLDKISFKRIKAGWKRYSEFPKYDVWSALINTFSLQIPVFILSAFFTTTIVGYYSLGLMILQMPMTFIGSAIAQVFFQRAAEANYKDKSALASLVENTIGRLIVIGFLPILLLSLIGKDLFTVVFGMAWGEAGVYTQILSFSILISFITSPITTLFTVKKKLKAFLLFNVMIMASRVGPLFCGGIMDDIYFGLILLSIFGGFSYIIMGYWIINDASVSLTKIIGDVWMPIFIGALILLVVAICKFFLMLNSMPVILVGIIGTILYFGISYAKDDEIKNMLMGMLH